jgi:hypothetical protein
MGGAQTYTIVPQSQTPGHESLTPLMPLKTYNSPSPSKGEFSIARNEDVGFESAEVPLTGHRGVHHHIHLHRKHGLKADDQVVSL